MFLCILIWLIFWFLPYIIYWLKLPFLHKCIGKEYVNLNMAFAAASALFTGLAFAGTIWNIWQQENNVSNLLEETSLKIFDSIFDKTTRDIEFRKAESYILNGSLSLDLEIIRKKNQRVDTINDLKK